VNFLTVIRKLEEEKAKKAAAIAEIAGQQTG
jgi:hypothetical protein